MNFRTLIAASIVTFGISIAGAQAEDFDITGDADKGAKVFRKCQACHAVGADAKNKVGPVLNGILGRAAATIDGFKYSKALTEAGADGLVWTPETIAEFLAKPKTFVKGTKMAFPGLRKDSEREDIVAYLATFEAE